MIEWSKIEDKLSSTWLQIQQMIIEKEISLSSNSDFRIKLDGAWQ